MSSTGNGTTQYMATAGTIPTPAGAYSYSFWYKATHVPNNSGGTTNPMVITDNGSGDLGVTWDHPDPDLYKTFLHIQGAGGFCVVQFNGTPTANVWNHYCVTWDGTTLSLYYNGILNATATGTEPTPLSLKITVLAYNSGASGFDDGSMAEFAVWDVCLTAAQAREIARGVPAETISTSDILFFSTLSTGDVGQIGPVITNHSTVINKSYFMPTDGGLKIGGDIPGSRTYTVSMEGGLAIGSNFQVTQAISNGAVVLDSGRAEAYTTK